MIGYVPQEIALYDELNTVENLLFFGKMYHIKRPELRRSIDTILEQVGLADKRKQPVKQFSGGMKRRLNIAAALLHKPGFIILDEPTVGIDPQSRNRIFEIVKALKNAGAGVLYITHYMEEAPQLCDRVAIMDGGRIITTDTVTNLLHKAGNCHMIRVEVDHLHEPDLQQVFLQLTGRNLRD